MKNLKTDFLDLLLLQRPGRLMRAYEINNVIDHIGEIKAFGVSNFTPS